MPQNAALFESIFKREISSPDTSAFLAQVAKEYPFFSPAQFFLLQQTSTEDDSFKLQAAKTSIHFNNPYWLSFQLGQQQAICVDKMEQATQEQHQEPIVEMIDEQSEEYPEEEAPENEAEPIKISIDLSAAETTEDSFNYAPLHTSDYFASQGIKLSEAVKAEDKLGKQLKSFTGWLKEMKKIQATETGKVEEQTDNAIQQLAENSNNEDEIVTEAMAEVLLQQNKAGKAIEVYEKLSLLNPSKSAYFAAKIEQLKAR